MGDSLLKVYNLNARYSGRKIKLSYFTFWEYMICFCCAGGEAV